MKKVFRLVKRARSAADAEGDDPEGDPSPWGRRPRPAASSSMVGAESVVLKHISKYSAVPSKKGFGKLHQAVIAQDLSKVRKLVAPPPPGSTPLRSRGLPLRRKLSLSGSSTSSPPLPLQGQQQQQQDLVNAPDGHLRTPLHLCATVGNPDIFRELLVHGARVDVKDEWGASPLLRAVDAGNTEVCRLLLDNGVNGGGGGGGGAGCPMDDPDLDGDTALHLTTRHNDSEIAAILLRRGANPDKRNKRMEAPLHEAIRSGKPDTAHLLLRGGASANLVGPNGATPLMLAASKPDMADLVETLLNYEADPDAVDNSGLDALRYAREFGQSGNADILVRFREELRQMEAGINDDDDDGLPPIGPEVLAAAKETGNRGPLLPEQGVPVSDLSSWDSTTATEEDDDDAHQVQAPGAASLGPPVSHMKHSSAVLDLSKVGDEDPVRAPQGPQEVRIYDSVENLRGGVPRGPQEHPPLIRRDSSSGDESGWDSPASPSLPPLDAGTTPVGSAPAQNPEGGPTPGSSPRRRAPSPGKPGVSTSPTSPSMGEVVGQREDGGIQVASGDPVDGNPPRVGQAQFRARLQQMLEKPLRPAGTELVLEGQHPKGGPQDGTTMEVVGSGSTSSPNKMHVGDPASGSRNRQEWQDSIDKVRISLHEEINQRAETLLKLKDEELVKAKGACKEATKALESQVEANQNMEEELARLRSEVKASVTEVEELRTKMRSESDKGGRFEALYHDTAAREFQVQGLLDQTMERVKVLENEAMVLGSAKDRQDLLIAELRQELLLQQQQRLPEPTMAATIKTKDSGCQTDDHVQVDLQSTVQELEAAVASKDIEISVLKETFKAASEENGRLISDTRALREALTASKASADEASKLERQQGQELQCLRTEIKAREAHISSLEAELRVRPPPPMEKSHEDHHLLQQQEDLRLVTLELSMVRQELTRLHSILEQKDKELQTSVAKPVQGAQEPDNRDLQRAADRLKLEMRSVEAAQLLEIELKLQMAEGKAASYQAHVEHLKVRLEHLEKILQETAEEKNQMFLSLKEQERLSAEETSEVVLELKAQLAREQSRLASEKETIERLQGAKKVLDQELKKVTSDLEVAQAQLESVRVDRHRLAQEAIDSATKVTQMEDLMGEQRRQHAVVIKELELHLQQERKRRSVAEDRTTTLKDRLDRVAAAGDLLAPKGDLASIHAAKGDMAEEELQRTIRERDELLQENRELEHCIRDYTSELRSMKAEAVKHKEAVKESGLKDRIIEELEQRVSMVRVEEATRLEKEVKKLRLKYEVQARNEVNARLVEINDFLTRRGRRQAEEEKLKQLASEAIQKDLANRLQISRDELAAIKDDMKGTERGIQHLQNLLLQRENELSREKRLRMQLEKQFEKTTEKRLISELLLRPTTGHLGGAGGDSGTPLRMVAAGRPGGSSSGQPAPFEKNAFRKSRYGAYF